jgi:TrmH family RNA methyltransferase
VIAVAGIPDATWPTLAVDAGVNIVLILDAIQDPGNVGTLIRSAEAFGATAVVILPGTVDPWNPKAVRAAAGSAFRIPLIVSTWEEARAALRSGGFALLGAAVGGESPGRRHPLRVGLVVGNEGAGLSPDVRADVDGFIGIPLRGRAESLNVAAAAAILLYELTGAPPSALP